MILFIVKDKRLECPYGLKGKLHLMKRSLVWLTPRRTRRLRTGHLLLHFHATTMMMPCAPPVVAPSPVLRYNWKTLADLLPDKASHRMFTRVLTPSSSAHRFWGVNQQTSSHLVLRHKLRNCHSDFEAQLTKPSTLVLRHKPRKRRHRFWG
jgi:hypothetical protein